MRVMRHSNADLTLKVYAKLGLADAHLELLKLGVATKVSPRIAESLAAVGPSGPAFVAVESAGDSAQGEKAAALASSLASVGRRGPAAGDSEEMVGRAGLEPATSTL